MALFRIQVVICVSARARHDAFHKIFFVCVEVDANVHVADNAYRSRHDGDSDIGDVSADSSTSNAPDESKKGRKRKRRCARKFQRSCLLKLYSLLCVACIHTLFRFAFVRRASFTELS